MLNNFIKYILKLCIILLLFSYKKQDINKIPVNFIFLCLDVWYYCFTY